MWRLSCYGATVLLLAAIGGCLEGPARSNPFDARSDAFASVGSVTGQVLDGVGQPLLNASVRLAGLPDGAATDADLILSTRTAAEGRFAFGDVPAGRYQLVAAREAGATSLRDTVEVEAGRVLELPAVSLNAPPVFADVSFDAVHVRQWSLQPGDVYFLEVAAAVTDPETAEEGVENVWLEVPAVDVTVPLREVQLGQYAEVIGEDRLPGEALHVLVGLDVLVKARDREGAVNQIGPLVLERVIENVPTPVAPDSFVQVTEARPTFVWETFQLPYPFTFSVRVHRVQDDLEIPVWEQHAVSRSATSLQMSEALVPGTYVWTVAAVDAFGNRGRSAQAGFRVVEE